MAEETLLDTSILIDALDHGKHTDLLEAEAGISVVSIYEFVRYKKQVLENKLLLEDTFDVFDLDNPVLLKAAEIFVTLKQNKTVIGENDIYIAATALANNLKLYAKDKDFLKVKRHFKDLNVQILND